MAFTIAMSNEKGGVAKTTSTLSLGAALAELNHRVLLIDLDPQANLSLALGLENGETEMSSANVLIENVPIRNAICKTEVQNLDIVPSDTRIETVEQFLPMRSNYLLTLHNALEAGALPYDYILLDCPPALGAITLNALSAADLLIIPTQAEYFSAYALRNMMGTIRRVRQESNPNLAYRILVTLLDRRNRTHRNIFEQLQATFGQGVLRTVTKIVTKLREGLVPGVPIRLYGQNSAALRHCRVLP